MDCYVTLRNCAECAKNSIKLRYNVGSIKLFPAPLESVPIDELDELINTPRGYRYILVITDHFTKLVKAVPMKGVSAGKLAKLFVYHWVFNYGTHTEQLCGNVSQFTFKVFIDVYRILNTKKAFTATYNPQTNGQVERFSLTILASFRSHIDNHPRCWDLYTPTLTYAYNSQQ